MKGITPTAGTAIASIGKLVFLAMLPSKFKTFNIYSICYPVHGSWEKILYILLDIKGLSDVKIIRLAVAFELARRVAQKKLSRE